MAEQDKRRDLDVQAKSPKELDRDLAGNFRENALQEIMNSTNDVIGSLKGAFDRGQNPINDKTLLPSLTLDKDKFKEHGIATGAKIGVNEAGDTHVSRTDSSSVSYSIVDSQPTIVEKSGDKSSTWTIKESTKDSKDKIWISKDVPGQERHNMALEKNGNLTFQANGEKHIIRSNGTELVEEKGKSSYNFDDQGRIKWIQYPDGNTVHGFEYKANTEEIAKVYTHDRRTNKTKTAIPDNTWGDPKITADGIYTQNKYQQFNEQIFKGKQTFNPDGSSISNTIDTNGTIKTVDSQGKQIGTRQANENDFVQEALGQDVPKDVQEDTEEDSPSDLSEDVSIARKELREALKAIGHNNKYTRNILDKLEERCLNNDGLTVPSSENLAEAYHTAADILKEPGVGVFSNRRLKNNLVLEGLRNLSDISKIGQGFDKASEPRPGSCGETNAEKYIAQRDAAAYMTALKQVVQTGSAEVGNEWLKPESITPGFEEKAWSIYKEGGKHIVGNLAYPLDGMRNEASKVIQNLCLAYAHKENGTKVSHGINHINIENFTKAMTGTAMLTVGPSGTDKSPNKINEFMNDTIARKLKADGRLPALVFKENHWMSVNNVREVQFTDERTKKTFTRAQVLRDNQYDSKLDKWLYPEQIYTAGP